MRVKVIRENRGHSIDINNIRKKELTHEILKEKDISYIIDENGDINLENFNDIELFKKELINRYLLNSKKNI